LYNSTHQFEPVRREFEVALQRKIKNSPYGKIIVGTISDSGVPELSQADQVLREEVIDRVYELGETGTATTSSNIYTGYGPTLASLGLAEQRNDCDSQQIVNENDGDDGELDLTGFSGII
jgi:hypothetical protein